MHWVTAITAAVKHFTESKESSNEIRQRWLDQKSARKRRSAYIPSHSTLASVAANITGSGTPQQASLNASINGVTKGV